MILTAQPHSPTAHQPSSPTAQPQEKQQPNKTTSLQPNKRTNSLARNPRSLAQHKHNSPTALHAQQKQQPNKTTNSPANSFTCPARATAQQNNKQTSSLQLRLTQPRDPRALANQPNHQQPRKPSPQTLNAQTVHPSSPTVPSATAQQPYMPMPSKSNSPTKQPAAQQPNRKQKAKAKSLNAQTALHIAQEPTLPSTNTTSSTAHDPSSPTPQPNTAHQPSSPTAQCPAKATARQNNLQPNKRTNRPTHNPRSPAQHKHNSPTALREWQRKGRT